MITAKQARKLSDKIRKEKLEAEIIAFKKTDKYISLQKEILEAIRQGHTCILGLKTNLNHREASIMEKLGYSFGKVGFNSTGTNYIYW